MENKGINPNQAKEMAEASTGTAIIDSANKMAVMPNFNADGLVEFADGGIVTGPTHALIGEAGYNEAVIPLKDSNDPLHGQEIVRELKYLRSEVRSLRADSNTYNREIERNTQESRYV